MLHAYELNLRPHVKGVYVTISVLTVRRKTVGICNIPAAIAQQVADLIAITSAVHRTARTIDAALAKAQTLTRSFGRRSYIG